MPGPQSDHPEVLCYVLFPAFRGGGRARPDRNMIADRLDDWGMRQHTRNSYYASQVLEANAWP